MISFLRNLTDKMNASTAARKARNAEGWERIKQKRAEREGTSLPSSVSDKYWEEQQSKEPSVNPVHEDPRQAAIARLKAGKSKIAKQVSWFIPPVAAVITLLIIHNNTWPVPEVRAFLADFGLRGEFALFLPIGAVIMILLAIVGAIIVNIVERRNKDPE